MADKIAHQVAVIGKYLKKPGNEFCADCRRPSPSWASINLGVFLCIKCSGCHREIGVHVTKIKSFNLDLWQPNTLSNFSKITNKIANSYWESKLPSDFDFEKIRKDDYRLQDFIRDKYERKRYANFKKIDPMSLIMQGYDISQDVDFNNSGSNAWEDEENISKEKIYVKPKAGMSFGINNKTEKKPANNNNIQQIKVPNPNITNKPLLDFDTTTVVQQNNLSQEINLIPQEIDSNILRSHTLPTNPEVKKTGFQFIKKKNTNPNQLPSQPLSPIPTNEPQQLKQQTLLSFDEPIIGTTSSNNENLIDLFSVQSQPTKAVQDLSNELRKVYEEKDDKTTNSVKIDMNHPNININNYWPYMPNTKMMPMNNQPSMMYPSMMNGYPMPMNQPYTTPVTGQYYMNQPIPLTQQPYVLDLYNPHKNDKIVPEQPPTFTYNSNYKDSLNKKKDNDPFKNLVSFS